MSLIGGQRLVESGRGEVESVGGHDAAAHEIVQLPEITTIFGGIMIATIRPRLVMHRRVNLRVANWSNRSRHFALNSDAEIVISETMGSFQSDWPTLHDPIRVDGRARPGFRLCCRRRSVNYRGGADRPPRQRGRSSGVSDREQ